MFSREGFAGRANRIKVIGLGSVAPCRSCWPVDLAHRLALLKKECGEAAAEASGAFDRPNPCPRCYLISKRQELPVSERVGRYLASVEFSSSTRHNRGSVGRLVRVHAYDVLDPFEVLMHGKPSGPEVNDSGVRPRAARL